MSFYHHTALSHRIHLFPYRRYSEDPLAAIKETLRRSAVTLLKVFQKPQFTDHDYHLSISKKFSHHAFTQAELVLFRHLFRWRDERARALDESTHFIMPLFLVFRLATRVPKEGASAFTIINCCDGVGYAAAYTRDKAPEVVKVMEKALQEAQDEATGRDELKALAEFTAAEEARKLERKAIHLRFSDNAPDTPSSESPLVVEAPSAVVPVSNDVLPPAVVTAAAAVPVTKSSAMFDDEESSEASEEEEEGEDISVSLPLEPAQTIYLTKSSTMFAEESSGSEDMSSHEDDMDASAKQTVASIEMTIREELVAKAHVPPVIEEVTSKHAQVDTPQDFMIETSVTYELPEEPNGDVVKDKEADTKSTLFAEDIIVLSEKKRKQTRKHDEGTSSSSQKRQRKDKGKADISDVASTAATNSPSPADIIPLTLDELKEMSAKADIARMGDGSVSHKALRKSRKSKGETMFDPYGSIAVDKKVWAMDRVGLVVTDKNGLIIFTSPRHQLSAQARKFGQELATKERKPLDDIQVARVVSVPHNNRSARIFIELVIERRW